MSSIYSDGGRACQPAEGHTMIEDDGEEVVDPDCSCGECRDERRTRQQIREEVRNWR